MDEYYESRFDFAINISLHITNINFFVLSRAQDLSYDLYMKGYELLVAYLPGFF